MMLRAVATGAMLAVLSAFTTTQVLAQTVAGTTVKWVKIEQRTIKSQLLKDVFDLRDVEGRTKALRLIADHGTIEIARVIVAFKEGAPLISNRFAVLSPKTPPYRLPIDAHGRAIDRITIVSSTARRSAGFGRLTLHTQQAIEIVSPPLPGSAAVRPAHTRAAMER
ncbi:MAG: hypothetical protein KDJ47_00655 [Hyphomicrobiaceae bacterium]|nr:hypothetical protein [Hyphomicrobiaceae bacterium]